MPTPPRKPVLPNVVLACVLAMMLAVGYLLSDCAINWLHGRGAISEPTLRDLEDTVFAPLDFHAERRLPGHKLLVRIRLYCYLKGLDSNAKWEEAVDLWP